VADPRLTTSDDDIQSALEPLSYQFCRIVNHSPDSTLHVDRREAGDIDFSFSPLHDVLDAPLFPTPIPSSSQLVPLEGAVPVIPAISRTAHTIPRSTFGGNSAQRQTQETETNLSSIGFDSPPTSTSIPSLRSRTIHPVSPASMDSIVTRTDYIAHTPGTPSSSSSDGARLSVPPQVSTVLDQSITFSVGGAGTYTDTQDPNPPTSTEAYRRPRQLSPSASDVAKNSFRREDRQRDPR
jgi:hypothetical protein